jgi:ribonuclease BN (tRNA processing enzyme)
MNIRILGAHNSESDKTKLTSLLIDNRLVIDAGGLTSSLSLESQWSVEAVLLTHRHYDHIRDILALAMNFYLAGHQLNIYAPHSVCEDISEYFFDGEIYPRFMELPEERPTVNITSMEDYEVYRVGSYDIRPVPVHHCVPSVGYQITTEDGKTLFFTGDTGPDLADCWKATAPQLLVAECTVTDEYLEFCKKNGHLSPELLKQELISFREINGYIPQVVTVHMSPRSKTA